jgi:hypothetical protein
MALSTSTTAPTGWAADAAHSNFLTAQGIASRPYQPYPGAGATQAAWNGGQWAGYNGALYGQDAGLGSQMAAEETARRAGTYQPQMVNAGGPLNATGPGVAYVSDAAAQGQNFTDANLGAYMNPYTGAVIDRTMQTLGRQNDVLNNQANTRAARAGAFGGGRQAVMNAENNRNFMDTAANATANLNSQNFLQAQGAIQGDQARAQQLSQYNATNRQQARSQDAQANNAAALQYASSQDRMAALNVDNSLRAQMANQQAGQAGATLQLSAANALNGMGLDQQARMLNGAQAAFGMGQARTAFDQVGVDNAYNQWAQAQNYPMQQLGILQQGLNGYNSGSTQTTPYYNNTGAQIASGVLGAGALGAGILQNGSAIAGGASALSGMLPDIGKAGWGGWF